MAALDNINSGSGQDTMQDFVDKTNLVIDRINGYYGELKTIRYNIGNWNMDTFGSKQVNTGLDSSIYLPRIVNINYQILDDSGQVHPIYSNTSVPDGKQIYENNFTIDISNNLIIAIYRGTYFDSTEFNDNIINRGYMYITFDMSL